MDNSSPGSSTYAVPTTQQDAEKLESTHVHDVYERIADHFSDTRHSPWPKIANFLRDLPKGSLVADVGCGNGKYLGINSNIFKTGSDRSFNLAAIAKERGHSVIVCDVLSLPYRYSHCPPLFPRCRFSYSLHSRSYLVSNSSFFE